MATHAGVTQVQIRLAAEGDRIMLEVLDNGPRIEREYAQTGFLRFDRYPRTLGEEAVLFAEDNGGLVLHLAIP